MSVPNQANGKKSSNSSIANTPASTPVTNTNGNPAVVIHNSPPPNNNAPKYGTLVPNRIFVGGISANTTEGELLQLFSSYGTVKAAKIIQDRAGVSKGYGFITFESEDDAKRPLREADNIVLRERKLNIAPAIKKQLSFTQPFNFNRAFDGSSPPTVTVGNPTQYFLPPGAMPYFQGSVGYYAPPNPPAPGDPNAQQPTVYQPPPVYPPQTGPPQAATYPSMMFPAQTIYMPQQYPMPMPYDYNYYPNNGAPPQFMVGAQGGPAAQGPPLPPSGSPPRPQCYNTPISYATEPVFYNVPMYGGPMEHPPVYADAVDNTGNPYTEEPYVGQFMSQDIVDVQYPTQETPPDTHHPTNITNTSSVTTATPPTEPDTTRQSNTPVVSLLCLDHSQEKDLNAMQGGRKKKPLPAPTPTMNAAVFPPPSGFQGLNYPPPPINYQPNMQPPVSFPPFPPAQPHFDYGQFKYPKYPPMNGYVRKPMGRRPFDRRNDYSNRSSVRTDSNSSAASAVDENRNHEEKLRTSVTTPPPAPYSPLTNHGYSTRFNGVVNTSAHYNVRQGKSYHNNNNDNGRRAATTTVPKGGNLRMNNGYARVPKPDAIPSNAAENNNNNNYPIKGLALGLSNKIQETNVSQVHTSSSSSFAPLPTRRSRRSIRRSNVGSVTLSEIGAGDAPLPPNADQVADACKKLDTLKL